MRRFLLTSFQVTTRTGGGTHDPSMTATVGQYARMKSEKSASFGAGSQLLRCASGSGSACT